MMKASEELGNACQFQQTSTPPAGFAKKSASEQDFKQTQNYLNTCASTDILSPDNCDKKVLKMSYANRESSHFPASLHPCSSHHPQGHTLRSDVYLRQALTSPFNQHAERQIKGGISPSVRDETTSFSPSSRREGIGHLLNSPHLERERCWQTGHVDGTPGSPAKDHLIVFKTPKTSKRIMFNSPDRAPQENSSPLSSVSGSGSSGRHQPHYNPFERGHDRLHFPLFSPDMFNVVGTPGRPEETFQWNLEHLAELRPVHIDDREIRRQMLRQSPDMAVEQRAQKAIDYYFQHHMVVPSPWSQDPPPHILPVTPADGSGGQLLATPDENQGVVQKELSRSWKVSDKSCQTLLTLPLELDLETVLGDYMNYQEGEVSTIGDSMSSTSLRRKLLFHADSSSLISPTRADKNSPDHVSAALCTPPHPKKCTPEWEKESSPEWKRKSPIQTPSSVQFSSSPISVSFHLEGDFRRSSFADLGGMASPELSPIVEKHRVFKSSKLRGFPALDTCRETNGQGAELGFGSLVRQHILHDESPSPVIASPDFSPITCAGSGLTGALCAESGSSKSRTMRANMSASFTSSPLHSSTCIHPQLHPATDFSGQPLPCSACIPASALLAQVSADISMDTQGNMDGGCWSPKDMSLMEAGHGDVVEALTGDPSQQPGSFSTLDTGYQTASGNGSLQTTQDIGGLTTCISTDVVTSRPDTNSELRKLASSLGSSLKEQAVGLAKPGNKLVHAGSVNSTGQLTTHSNLTDQFINLPFQSEVSAGCTELQTNHSATQDTFGCSGYHGPAVVRQKGSHWQDPSSGNGGMTVTQQTSTFLESVNASSVVAHKSVSFFSLGDSLLDTDASFLEKIADYLEKGDDANDFSGYIDAERESAALASTSVAVSSVTSAVKELDDSVLERARQYLASVHQSETVARFETTGKSQCDADLPLLKALGSATPGKRLLGKIAEDLAASRDAHSGPALASDIAKEILRRAELDLKRVNQANYKDGSS